jgi:hypothetical protein
MAFSKQQTFNRLATSSAFIKFEPKWLDLDNQPIFAMAGEYAPVIPPYHVRSSIDSHGYRFVIIGLDSLEQQCNIVFYETESKDNTGGEELFMCYYSDTTGENRVVHRKTTDEQLNYILRRYAQRINHRTSMIEYENAKLLHPSIDL